MFWFNHGHFLMHKFVARIYFLIIYLARKSVLNHVEITVTYWYLILQMCISALLTFTYCVMHSLL